MVSLSMKYGSNFIFLILFTNYLSNIHLKHIFTLIWNVASIGSVLEQRPWTFQYCSLPLQNRFVFPSASQFLHLPVISGNCITLTVTIFQPDMPLFINFTDLNGSCTVPMFVLNIEIQKKIKQAPVIVSVVNPYQSCWGVILLS